MKKDKDIDKYEEKENKPPEPQPESILVNLKVPEIDFSNAGDLGEAIDNLSVFIMACSLKLTERTLNGYKTSADDEYKLTQLRKQLKFIQDTYKDLVKSGRLSGGKNSPTKETDKSFLTRIKETKTTIGSIVQDGFKQ